MAKLKGLVAHIKALNLALEENLTEDEKNNYKNLCDDWIVAYLSLTDQVGVWIGNSVMNADLRPETKARLCSSRGRLL